jgi:hypothetical protein
MEWRARSQRIQIMLAKLTLLTALLACVMAQAVDLPPVAEVEGQPLAANAQRIVQALDFLGRPLADELRTKLQTAITARDGMGVQAALDPQVLCVVDISPESRVKAQRGPAAAQLQQAGYTPVLIKVINHATSVARLQLSSPQAGPSYAGVAKGTMERERQTHLRENENTQGADRFMEIRLFDAPPMTANLSGLEVEYAIALIYSSEAGKREATLVFDIGQGTQDLGFRAEVPALFQIPPAVTVKLGVKDFDGQATTARLTFTNAQGQVFPPQARRLAPDFFFQKHLYRPSGGTVLLPPGEFMMEASRGPEYRTVKTKVMIPAAKETTLAVKLERWIHAADFGYYSGDHHIHAAGCAHYTSPSEGMRPEHMFQQVKGEGLNVGCVLAWGYCFDYQRQFFGPQVDLISEPLTQMKYDMEVSGFGSAALGHVCLLNLHELVYPGADGIKGWPTWTLPALRWTKQQGGFTGYPHSGSGMQVNSATAAKRMLDLYDASKDARLTAAEAQAALLPEAFDKTDADHDGGLNEAELVSSHERVLDLLPNVAIPDAGGHEIFVTTAHGVCDFISAMDTARLLEWNTWYHLMNCGFPLKAAGETDFPCMSGTRVGQGRTYVKLGKTDRIDFKQWCEAMAQGRSYVSDGYAHALDFTVAGQPSGGEVRIAQPGKVEVRVKAAFSSETPLEIAYGGAVPLAGARLSGDTVNYHDSTAAQPYAGGKRKVELIVNGLPVAMYEVPADDQVHEITFSADIARSSWVAVRQFPQMHTNPVNVLVAEQPIRASRRSAQWCLACIEQLWRVREKNIAPAEREEARHAYEAAKEIYRRIAAEALEGS